MDIEQYIWFRSQLGYSFRGSRVLRGGRQGVKRNSTPSRHNQEAKRTCRTSRRLRSLTNYSPRDAHPDYGADSVFRREAEALQKAAAAEARCQLIEERKASGGFRSVGLVQTQLHSLARLKWVNNPLFYMAVCQQQMLHRG